jgi:hypothetical protein
LCLVCFAIVSEDVIQRTDKTMAKQTRDKRAMRRCNSKNRQNNGYIF